MTEGLPPRIVTVADVAAAARVSKAAAARALAGYGSVSAAVKVRVLEAARALDYRPNELARTMATGRSGTIGVVVGDIENPFFGLAVRGLSDRAHELGFNVILANSGERAAAERAATRVLAAKRVDGLVVAPAAMDRADHLADLVGRGCPLVLLDRDIPGLAVDASLVDTRSAAGEATALLLGAGHRRLAYVTATEAAEARYRGPEQVAISTVLDRIEGFVGALQAAGIEDPEVGIRLGATDDARAAHILDTLLSGPDRVTAILASDSKIALHVFRAARRLGLSLPNELSLISFDDADWASAITPAVTVVAQPAYELGVQAAQLLADRIAGHSGPPRRRRLDTTLIRRESVAPPAGTEGKVAPRRADGN